VAEVVGPVDVANLLSYVAPGVVARASYGLVYPQSETGQLRGLVVAVASSLPLVAVLRPLAEALGADPARPYGLGYVAVLLGGSLVAGYIWALLRGARITSAALGRLTHPTLRAERSIEPQGSVLHRVVDTLPDKPNPTWVTVGLMDGRRLRGTARLWSAPLDTRQQLFLQWYKWRNKDDTGWERQNTNGGVVVDLAQMTFVEVHEDPVGLETEQDADGNAATVAVQPAPGTPVAEPTPIVPPRARDGPVSFVWVCYGKPRAAGPWHLARSLPGSEPRFAALCGQSPHRSSMVVRRGSTPGAGRLPCSDCERLAAG
jgi:hypothetical protein